MNVSIQDREKLEYLMSLSRLFNDCDFKMNQPTTSEVSKVYHTLASWLEDEILRVTETTEYKIREAK